MKKILLCLLVLFLVGCIPLEGLKEQGPEQVEEYVQEGVGFVKEIVANEYKIKPGGSLVVDGVKVQLTDITSEYEVKIKVNDIDYTIYETQKQEVVDGLDFKAKEIKFDPTGKDTYTILKIVKFVPNENEYLLHINEEAVIGDHKVTMLAVDTDTLQSILVRVDTADKRINKGQTERINNLDIINVDTNPRAVTSEKYAIIKVIPVTF